MTAGRARPARRLADRAGRPERPGRAPRRREAEPSGRHSCSPTMTYAQAAASARLAGPRRPDPSARRRRRCDVLPLGPGAEHGHAARRREGLGCREQTTTVRRAGSIRRTRAARNSRSVCSACSTFSTTSARGLAVRAGCRAGTRRGRWRSAGCEAGVEPGPLGRDRHRGQRLSRVRHDRAQFGCDGEQLDIVAADQVGVGCQNGWARAPGPGSPAAVYGPRRCRWASTVGMSCRRAVRVVASDGFPVGARPAADPTVAGRESVHGLFLVGSRCGRGPRKWRGGTGAGSAADSAAAARRRGDRAGELRRARYPARMNSLKLRTRNTTTSTTFSNGVVVAQLCERRSR